jgi:hypothetical protein
MHDPETSYNKIIMTPKSGFLIKMHHSMDFNLFNQ